MNPTPDGTEQNRPGGPLAPTAPGTPPIKLTTPQKWLVAAALLGGIAIAGIGFVGSYSAVTALARSKGFGDFSRVFTLGIDIGIGVFLAIDLLLTWLRMPYPVLRYGAWLLTAATIVFNASVLWPDPLGAAMHGVIPVLFIVAVEAARHAVGRMAQIVADKHIEGPPASRWILNPVGTFILWRRQLLWAIREWDTVLTLERQRRIYIGQLRKEHGRGWRRKAHAEQALVLRLARDGMSIEEAIELPKAEERKLAEAEAKREAEASAKAEAEAEAKHQAELRAAEVEAKRRAEIAEAEAAEARARAEAEAAEAEAKGRAAVAAEATRLEVEAKRREQAEAARLLVAETEAKLADIAREQRDAEAEADLNQRRRTAEQGRLREEALRQERAQREEADRKRREEQARERAQQIATSASAGASASAPRRSAASGSASGSASSSVSPIGGRGAKRQGEVEAVLARMVEANDPEVVSLKWIEEHFGLKQTTAYDRLVTAQQLFAAAQDSKSERPA